MRRTLACVIGAAIAMLALASSANAAVPTLGPLSATDLQGVSAVLVGSVNPEGLDTMYRFEYADNAALSGAVSTSLQPAGQGTGPHPARVAIAGLSPSTTYYYRLVASNSSGTAQSSGTDTFATTQGFGFLAGEAGFAAKVYADGGKVAEVAGTHPYQVNLDLGLQKGGAFEGQPGASFADGDLRDLRIDLPPGMLLNPAALATCDLAELHTPRTSHFESPSLSGESCPDKSQVGTIELQSSLGGGHPRSFGLFNLTPPPGVAAQIGAAPFGSPVVFDVSIKTNDQGAYTLALDAAEFPQALPVYGISLDLWGTPWNQSHDAQRGNCLNEAEPGFGWGKCSVGDPHEDSGNTPAAYLTLPTGCEGPLSFSASARSWQQGGEATAVALNRGEGGNPVSQGGCQGFSFTPSASGQLSDTKASSSSGFAFTLANDNSALTLPEAQVPSQARLARVTLPSGSSLNPSLGAGLEGCTAAQFARESATSLQGQGCPNGAKIGDFTVRTPLFSGLLEGAIYLAQPRQNPFGTLLAVYLVARLPERGVVVKLVGRLDPDPATGQLVASFEGLPQLPYTDLDVTFRTGQRAPLVTPAGCGQAITQIDLTPWSGPGTKHTQSATQILSGVGGGPCPAPGAPPFAPAVTAGGVNSNVNSYTPYFVHITRGDAEQELTSYSLVLPKGLTGKLAGVPFCPEAEIEAARHNSGFAETEHPSCPVASQVGRTLSGYGVGSALTYAPGRVYLAGPYHGAPLSLVTVNAATVGPFDLGTIVIRSAFQVDPRTAQLRIDSRASDPIPHILDGIPLHLRDVRIYMDRFQFTHNPSSCEPSALESTLTGSGARFSDSSDDSTTQASSHFQLLNCLTLGFKPKLGLRLRGGSRRGAFPALRATFAARGPKDSNLKQIEVVMPHAEFLAQNHIRAICGIAAFEADRCPPDSTYGHAVAYTPLFDAPLRGDVYLRSAPGRHLPDLVASLHSGAIRIVLEGRIGPAKGGGVRAFFAGLPDAPIERFTMVLDGGKRGLLQNSTNICAIAPLASIKALSQSNIGATFTTKLRGQCAKGKGKTKAKRAPR